MHRQGARTPVTPLLVVLGNNFGQRFMKNIDIGLPYFIGIFIAFCTFGPFPAPAFPRGQDFEVFGRHPWQKKHRWESNWRLS